MSPIIRHSHYIRLYESYNPDENTFTFTVQGSGCILRSADRKPR